MTDQEERHGGRLARAGLAARGVLYVVLSLLTLQLVLGGSAEADKQGAFDLIARQPFGKILLGALTLGLFAYAASRLWMAVRGPEVGGPETTLGRLGAAARALVNVGIGGLAASTLLGGGGTSSGGSTSSLMGSTAGRAAVGIVGLVMLGVAVRQLWATTEEPDELDESQVSGTARDVLEWVRNIGLTGRAISFTTIGGFLLHSAITRDGSAGGLDVALNEVRQTAVGGIVLVAVTVGFAAFGAFCLAEARHHQHA